MTKYKVECQISAIVDAESEEAVTEMLESDIAFGVADIEVLAINSIREAQ